MLKQTKLNHQGIVVKEISAELKGKKKPNPKSLAVTDLSLQDVEEIFSITPDENAYRKWENIEGEFEVAHCINWILSAYDIAFSCALQKEHAPDLTPSLQPRMLVRAALLNGSSLPSLPASQELNIQFEPHLQKIITYKSRLRTLTGRADYTLFYGPLSFIEGNSCIVEAKPSADFGNGTAQTLAYLCEFLYSIDSTHRYHVCIYFLLYP